MVTAGDYSYSSNNQTSINKTRITVIGTSSMTRLTAMIIPQINYIAAIVTASYSYSIHQIANY